MPSNFCRKNSDVLRRRRHPRDLNIWALARLGWMMEKAGGLFGLGRSTVNEIVGKLQMQKSDICGQSVL